MNFKILIIIGAVVVVLIVALIIFLSISNKRKSKQLQDNLKKYKQETKDKENTSITLSTDEVGQNLSEDELLSDDFLETPKEEEKENEFEDFDFNFDDFLPKNFGKEPNFNNDRDRLREPDRFRNDRRPRGFEERDFRRRRPDKFRNERNRNDRDDDFEQFLNEHSFTRKVLDKSLISQIQKLPPEIKAVIMSNVFDKFNDDNK